MGCRALVAYERPDASYTLHYSHNGAFNYRLTHELTPKTPFGSEESSQRARDHLKELFASTDKVEDERTVGRQARTPVNPHPIGNPVSLDEIHSEYLDFLHHEAFYVVAQDFDVTAYRTHWLGLKYDCKSVDASETLGNGVLQPVAWTDGDPVHNEYDHGKFQALKDVTGDRIDDGELALEDARTYLIEKLQAWSPDEMELLVPQD